MSITAACRLPVGGIPHRDIVVQTSPTILFSTSPIASANAHYSASRGVTPHCVVFRSSSHRILLEDNDLLYCAGINGIALIALYASLLFNATGVTLVASAVFRSCTCLLQLMFCLVFHRARMPVSLHFLALVYLLRI